MASAVPYDPLLEYFKLETQVCQGYNVETEYHKQDGTNRRTKVVEKRWSRQEGLGFGAFGEVWLERDQDGMPRALKEVQKRRYPQIDYHKELLAMAQLSRYARLELFVHFYGWFETNDSLYLAMEYFPLGDLHKCVASSGVCTEDEAKAVACQLLEGLNFMHQMGFTHRDLKPKNVLVRQASPEWNTRIGDFGIAKRTKPTDSTALVTQAGTPHFRAPEVDGFLNEDTNEYTNAVDIWSLGCVIFWVLTKEVPFPSSDRRFNFARGVTPFPVENLQARDVSDQGIKFLQVLISADPLKRPTALAALKSLWITPSVPAIDGKNTMDADSKADSGEPDLSHTSQDAKTSNADDAVNINFNAPEVSNSGRETKSGESERFALVPTFPLNDIPGPIPVAPSDEWVTAVIQYSSNATRRLSNPLPIQGSSIHPSAKRAGASEVKRVTQHRPWNDDVSDRMARLPYEYPESASATHESENVSDSNIDRRSTLHGEAGSHRRAPRNERPYSVQETSSFQEEARPQSLAAQSPPPPRASDDNTNNNATWKYLATAAMGWVTGATVNQALQPAPNLPSGSFSEATLKSTPDKNTLPTNQAPNSPGGPPQHVAPPANLEDVALQSHPTQLLPNGLVDMISSTVIPSSHKTPPSTFDPRGAQTKYGSFAPDYAPSKTHPKSTTLPSRDKAQFVWHEKYERYYRDFEEGDLCFRQYDNGNGKPIELLRPTIQNRPTTVTVPSEKTQEEAPSTRRSPKTYMETSAGQRYYIKGTKGKEEVLEHRYKKRTEPSKFFRVGRVFAVLWYGGNESELSLHDSISKYETKRMVVVKEGRGCCWCIPISTYGGRGTARNGRDPSAHAIIYMSDTTPSRLPSETGMTKKPLQVDPAGPDQKLDAMSRVSFARVYTVEDNVKVMKIGKISPSSMKDLVWYFHSVQEKKG